MFQSLGQAYVYTFVFSENKFRYPVLLLYANENMT